MHTNCSDGQLKPEVLIEQAVSIGLKGFAITDHHTVEGYKIAQDWVK
jgi:predicted metal-dependent phosphoesterase TrpH